MERDPFSCSQQHHSQQPKSRSSPSVHSQMKAYLCTFRYPLISPLYSQSVRPEGRKLGVAFLCISTIQHSRSFVHSKIQIECLLYPQSHLGIMTIVVQNTLLRQINEDELDNNDSVKLNSTPNSRHLLFLIVGIQIPLKIWQKLS